MKWSTRHGVYLLLVIGVLWLVYLGRGVLPPFVLAVGCAYILNPLVEFLSRKIKLPRVVVIGLIYAGLVGTLAVTLVTFGARLAEESASFTLEARSFIHLAGSQVGNLPIWLQPVAVDLLNSVRSTVSGGPRHVAAFIPGIVNGTVNILVFLVAAFYFLKDGHRFVSGFLSVFPAELRFEAEVIVKKVNKVLGDYLRAQLLLVLIMSTFTYIGLLVMGVKYALVVALFTGIAEIVPFIGPVVAAALAMFVAYTDGVSTLGLDPVMQMAVVGGFYAVLRELEDLFVIPTVLGKMTKLHPIAVLFVVLLGGHLFGVFGVILAVPVAASLKVVLGHVLGVLNKE